MWVASAGEDEHPDPGEGPEAARVNVPRRWRVKDYHRPRPPTCP